MNLPVRRARMPWTETGFVLRYHVGLEDPDDLITDLQDGFSRLQAGAKRAEN